mmetsp:Transcript_14670/g.32375  ORF Transcript_14670/g.32375 Transcript_14670/m.32375 type:complete len:170 (+) Transcript_14670:1478-1987(+)
MCCKEEEDEEEEEEEDQEEKEELEEQKETIIDTACDQETRRVRRRRQDSTFAASTDRHRPSGVSSMRSRPPDDSFAMLSTMAGESELDHGSVTEDEESVFASRKEAHRRRAKDRPVARRRTIENKLSRKASAHSVGSVSQASSTSMVHDKEHYSNNQSNEYSEEYEFDG